MVFVLHPGNHLPLRRLPLSVLHCFSPYRPPVQPRVYTKTLPPEVGDLCFTPLRHGPEEGLLSTLMSGVLHGSSHHSLPPPVRLSPGCPLCALKPFHHGTGRVLHPAPPPPLFPGNPLVPFFFWGWALRPPLPRPFSLPLFCFRFSVPRVSSSLPGVMRFLFLTILFFFSLQPFGPTCFSLISADLSVFPTRLAVRCFALLMIE